MVEPWSKFFWSDYEADEGLRVCSLAAQGLWMRMLCLMARATPKGELRIAGEPCSVRDLAKLVSESDETVDALLGELRRRGVFSTTRAGVIFSRRIRNDTIISRKRAESGAKGAAVTNGKYGTKSDLPQQNVSKPPGKSSAPEARSQKLEEPPTPFEPETEPEAEIPVNGGRRIYVFSGKTIRLTSEDFDRWKTAYHAIPDLCAELTSIDDWLDTVDEAVRKRWFHSVSKMLGRKHSEALAAAPQGKSGGTDAFIRRLERFEAKQREEQS